MKINISKNQLGIITKGEQITYTMDEIILNFFHALDLFDCLNIFKNLGTKNLIFLRNKQKEEYELEE